MNIRVDLTAGNKGIYYTIEIDGKVIGESCYEETSEEPLSFLIRKLLALKGTHFAYDNFGELDTHPTQLGLFNT
jgi:hypothetical protein